MLEEIIALTESVRSSIKRFGIVLYALLCITTLYKGSTLAIFATIPCAIFSFVVRMQPRMSGLCPSSKVTFRRHFAKQITPSLV